MLHGNYNADRAAVSLRRLGRPLPRRVLVLRALQLGDLLCAVPAFRALRTALPETEIILVGLPWARMLVERYPNYLNGFRPLPGYPGLPEQPPQPQELPAFLSAIQAEKFDLALQLHGSGTITNPLCCLFGARLTAGFYAQGGYRPDPERFMPWPEHGLELRRLLALLEFLGIPACGEDLEFPLRARDHESLHAIDGTRELRPGRYVCIHPGASVPERRWPVERFAVVARALETHGLRVVLTGNSAERELTSAIAQHLTLPPLDLAGRTDLGALGALLSGVRLLVCNDTGVAHLAAALRVPSVIVSTGDNPERWAPVDARRHRVLCRDVGVETDEVLRAAAEFLRGDGRPASAIAV
ncbi:MAG TPA: glycosyltransferase family 9 protein [Gemmataceae bacterium]|nr:glycosyltransferase family 9 protein [Gemmataceae bacterium]